MNLKALIQSRDLYDLLSQIRELYQKEEYEEALVLTENALRLDTLLSGKDPADALFHFLFFKAEALDATGQVEKALLIYEDLVKYYPRTSQLKFSIHFVCLKLQNRAKLLIQEDPNHPKIVDIYTSLELHTFPPYWLLSAVAAREIYEGKVDLGMRRVETLLSLSPNDAEYLRCAISLAKFCGRKHEVNKMLKHVKSLLEERPYRLDLLQLFEEEEVTVQEAAS